MRIFLVSSMVLTAGLVASMTTWLIQSTRARHQQSPHPVVRITVHHRMPGLPSDLFLDEDDAALCGCPRCALCPPDEDDQFDYSLRPSPAQIKRLHFARWLVEQGRISEF